MPSHLEGGGVRAWPLKKKFFEAREKKNSKNVATNIERAGGKALVARPLKKELYFFAASINKWILCILTKYGYIDASFHDYSNSLKSFYIVTIFFVI